MQQFSFFCVSLFDKVRQIYRRPFGSRDGGEVPSARLRLFLYLKYEYSRNSAVQQWREKSARWQLLVVVARQQGNAPFQFQAQEMHGERIGSQASSNSQIVQIAWIESHVR